jgi:hypothetical protein
MAVGRDIALVYSWEGAQLTASSRHDFQMRQLELP